MTVKIRTTNAFPLLKEYILHTIVILLLLAMGNNAAYAATTGDSEKTSNHQTTSFDKMPGLATLSITQLIPLTYVPPSNIAAKQQINSHFLPKITAKKWSNGKYSIEGKGHYKHGAPCLSYEYKVDLKNKTYTLQPVTHYDLDDSYLKLQAMTSKTNRKTLTQARAMGLDIEDSARTQANRNDICHNHNAANQPSATAANKPQALSAGIYEKTVSLRTRDIPNWTITRTTAKLQWVGYSSGIVGWLYWSASFYAVNPSPINTHWFIDHHEHWGPYFNSTGSNVSKNAYGIYENYDWGWDDEYTKVSQHVKITGNSNGSYAYDWNHYDWGEDATFIWGVITIN